MVGRLAPDPGEVGDAGVREDQPHPGVPTGGLDRVAPERRDAAARVHQHRQAPLVREREHRLQPGVVERELLRARMELDSARAAGERALGLGERVVVRVRAGRTGTGGRRMRSASSITMSFAAE